MPQDCSTAPNVKALTSDLFANKAEYIMFRIAKRVVDLTPELEAKGRAPLSLSMGAPTVPPPPALVDKLKELLDEPGIHTYSTPRGEAYFRDAVAQRMKRRFGITLDPKTEICSLIGSKEGLAQMFRGVVTPRFVEKEQDIILTPDPGYASYAEAIQAAGGLAYPMPLTPENRYLPDMEDVLAKLKQDGYDPSRVKAMILCYPSNPLGVGASLAYYEQVVAFARKHNILIISDIAYADLYFPGAEPPHSVLEVPGAKDIAIEFHSMSKPFAATGWRLGYAIGNKDAVDVLAIVKSTADSGLFKAMQKAAAFALNDESCSAYMAATNKTYQINQQTFLAGLKKLGWPTESMLIPTATFYLWMPIPPRYNNCVDFSNEMLEKSGIVVVPGVAFGQQGEGYVRLSLVLSAEKQQQVLDRMAEDGFTYG